MSLNKGHVSASQPLDGWDLRHILLTMPVGAALLNYEGQVEFVNNEFSELTGYSLDELAGLNHQDFVKLLVPNEDFAEISSNWRLTKNGFPILTKRNFKHKGGFQIPLMLNAYPVYDLTGRVNGTMLVCRDLHSELLLEITRILSSSLKLEDVLLNTTIVVGDYLGLFSTAIFLVNKDTQLLKLHSCSIYQDPMVVPEILVPVGVGAPGLIAQKREPVYVPDLGETDLVKENISDAELIGRFAKKSSIGYPLLFGGELLGVIAFDADCIREFTVKERRLFENIAGQVALAIHNAQMYSEVERLSITDELTSLYNHRYFESRLSEELTRAGRQSKPFSLLMIDIDHFKNYNDTYGHLQGNKLLVELAQLIKSHVRSFDVVCRFGGEEFTVILPDCGADEALNISHRLRQACEDNNFLGKGQLAGGKITISIGVSTYPEAASGDELVNSADKALYKAKRQSRNSVGLA